MKKARWRSRIVTACVTAGTYRTHFEDVIDTLAWILETRDEAVKEYKKSNDGPIVEHTNKAGATNREQNPTLRLINDLNRDALAYWRDLGLTPAGLKKINEEALKPRKLNSLDKVLIELA